MSHTDFFDDDLVRKPEPAKPEPDDAGVSENDEEQPVRPAEGGASSRMARQREEVSAQVSQATEELERLRLRQQQIEREKRALEDLRRKQNDFEQGKAEMNEQLRRNLLTLEREEVRSQQLVDMLAATRKRFREMLKEIESFDEEAWEEERFTEELNTSLGRIEDMRMEFKKSIGKIRAMTGEEGRPDTAPAGIYEESARPEQAPHTFTYWFKAGLAFTLPLLVLLLLAFIVSLVMRLQAWM